MTEVKFIDFEKYYKAWRWCRDNLSAHVWNSYDANFLTLIFTNEKDALMVSLKFS